MKRVCCVCGEEYEKGFMVGKNFHCKHCFMEWLDDQGVKEVC